MKTNKLFLILFSIGFNSSVSFAQNRISLIQPLQDVLKKIESPEFNLATCSAILQKHVGAINGLTGAQYELQTLQKEAADTIQKSWNLRLALQKKFRELHTQGNPDQDCVDLVRKALNVQRDVEDYMGEVLLREKGQFGTYKSQTYRGGFPDFLINPKYADFTHPTSFKSGDILMSRGNSFVSAAIARSGGAQGQFSHLSLVYIDEKTQKAYTIESHIESGVLVRPLQDHIDQENARETIYRYPDAQMAHAAAKIMYDLALQYKEPDTLPYDFQRNMNDASALDCTEIIRTGFRRASNDKILFPQYITHLPKSLKPFINSIGVKTELSFSPEDIEVDPRLELVAEWRNFNKVEDIRFKNEIIGSLISWMKNEKYSFRFDLSLIVKRGLAWRLRHWPFYLLKDKVPITMTKQFMSAGLVMDDIGTDIAQRLRPKVDFILKNRKTPVTPHEVLSMIEQIRQDDWQVYLEGNYKGPDNTGLPWPFHEQFRP